MLFCYTFATLFATLCYNFVQQFFTMFCYTFGSLFYYTFHYTFGAIPICYTLHCQWHWHTLLVHFLVHFVQQFCTFVLHRFVSILLYHSNTLCHINRPCNSSLSHWQDGTVFAIYTGLYRSVGLWPLCKNYCFTDVDQILDISPTVSVGAFTTRIQLLDCPSKVHPVRWVSGNLI